jgi:hypothetical protein
MKAGDVLDHLNRLCLTREALSPDLFTRMTIGISLNNGYAEFTREPADSMEAKVPHLVRRLESERGRA